MRSRYSIQMLNSDVNGFNNENSQDPIQYKIFTHGKSLLSVWLHTFCALYFETLHQNETIMALVYCERIDRLNEKTAGTKDALLSIERLLFSIMTILDILVQESVLPRLRSLVAKRFHICNLLILFLWIIIHSEACTISSLACYGLRISLLLVWKKLLIQMGNIELIKLVPYLLFLIIRRSL